LRRYDARRDMAALANLIETSFGERLDESGRRMIREMRLLGKTGWLGWFLSRWLLPPAANPYGFVWETDGQVVGNASLLPVEHFPHRWVIANVAVSPEHRQKGIAGRLVDASVGFAHERGARQLILQVDADNERAHALYLRRGFEVAATRTVWIARRMPPSLRQVDPGPVRKRRIEEWRDQWELAKRLHPEGLIWPYPSIPSIFRPGGIERLFSASPSRHWVWPEGDRLRGSLSLRLSTRPGVWRIVMIVEPEHRGMIEADLLSGALQNYKDAQWTYILDYPHDAAEDLLRDFGFRPQRTLTWMSKTVDQDLLLENGEDRWN
jgi:ribosomal protein S18 acetylase RimI-like enzyme